MVFDLVSLIKAGGLFGVFAIVFAESGLFVGFFLPGDSLLFTAGFLASQNLLPIVPLAVGSFIAAVLGDSFGYFFGKKTGPAIFKRRDSRFFNRKNIEKARDYYEKHGPATIFLARFIPVVRTFAPILAGVGEMRYRTFLSYNSIGGLVWGAGLPLSGYYLGRLIPDVDRYLLPIVLLIILVSISPGIVQFFKSSSKKSQ